MKRRQTLFLVTLFFSVIALGRVHAQSGGSNTQAGNPGKGDVEHLAPIPVQSYAVIDVSAANGVASPVSQVVVGDDNAVRYSYYPDGYLLRRIVVNTWQPSTGSNAPTESLAVDIDPPHQAVPEQALFYHTELNFRLAYKAQGAVYACCDERIDGPYSHDSTIDWDNIFLHAGHGDCAQPFVCSQGGKSLLKLPVGNFYTDWKSLFSVYGPVPKWPGDKGGLYLSGCSEAGYFGSIFDGGYVPTDPNQASESGYSLYGWNERGRPNFVVAGGVATIFDNNSQSARPPNTGAVWVSADYEPKVMNKWGQTAGVDGFPASSEAYFWRYPTPAGLNQPAAGEKPIDLGPGQPCGLSAEGRVLILNTQKNSSRTICRARLWQGVGASDYTYSLAPTTFRAYDSIQPLSISNENPDDHSFHVLTQVSSEKDTQYMVWKNIQPPTPDGGTTPPPRETQPYLMQFPAGVTIKYLGGINSSGLVAAYGDTQMGINHALLLLPINLVDLKKTIDPNDDVPVESKTTVQAQNDGSIAWIWPHDGTSGSPEMPHLSLELRGAKTFGFKIRWKLAVKYKRPRGNQPDAQKIKEEDEVFIPKKLDPQQEQPWKVEALNSGIRIFENESWISELQDKGFFGGEAELKYQLLNANGNALGSEASMLFSIGGLKPDSEKAKAYIDALAALIDVRLIRLSYAIARHESKDYNKEGSYYNQFWEGYGRRFQVDHRNGDPLWCKGDGEDSAGGFGIFQITGDAIHGKYYNVPRKVLWNWQENAYAYFGIVVLEGDGKPLEVNPSKNGAQLRFFDFIQNIFGAAYEAPPVAYSYKDLSLDSWEMGVVTLYNGVEGCPAISVILPNGKKKEKQNPWGFSPKAASGNRWRYNKNTNDYLYEVIQQR